MMIFILWNDSHPTVNAQEGAGYEVRRMEKEDEQADKVFLLKCVAHVFVVAVGARP